MKRIPNLPRPVPEITVGTTVTGSDVIDCRIVVHEADPGAGPGADPAAGAAVADLTADGVWEVRVPRTATALTDLVDLAEEPRLADDGWRAAAAVLTRRVAKLIDRHPVRAKRHTVQIRVPEGTTVQNLRNLAQGIVLGRRQLSVTRRDPAAEVRSVHVDISDIAGATETSVLRRAEDGIHRGIVMGAATALARDVNAVPAPTATSVWWRRKAKAVLGDVPGTRVKTHGRGWLQRKGFGGILATATATASSGVNDPDGEDEVGFVEMFWDPAAAEGDLNDERPDVLLVGGAPVPAVIRALAELRGPQKVVGLVPVHGYSPPASVPGRARTVVEHVNGATTLVPGAGSATQRVEVCRRLALADAVAYGVQRYRPRRVVVVGAVSTASKSALGERTGAVFGDPQAVRRVTLRGARVGERWWPLPTPEYLEKKVSSREADLTVLSDGPDALTAAMFLRRFAGGVPCAVLDTTGPSWSDSVHGEVDRGSTGFAARTLVEWFRK